jgi:outer membrane protein assembly factor BamB
MIRVFLRLLAASLTLAVAAACATTPSSLRTNAELPSSGESSVSAHDDWITFGHDFERSGFQPQNVGLSKANVKKLKLRWKRSAGGGVYASPIAYGGSVIVVTLGENVHAAIVTNFRAKDGAVMWRRKLSGGVRATPSIDPDADELFVSDRRPAPEPSTVYAIRLLDGSIAWQHSVPGLTHASPVVAGGRVYVGVSGGDPPVCADGGVIAFNERTGAQVWRWEVNPVKLGGGSVWGAIGFDGAHLIFGTGNTCTTPMPTANGAVALDLNGKVVWNFTAQKNAFSDDDTGSGVLIAGGHATFMSKNGTLYALGQGSGSIAWAAPLGAADLYGGFATPSTDGSTIVAGAGSFPASASRPAFHDDGPPQRGAPNDIYPGYTSRLDGLDTNGTLRWSRPMLNRITGDAALCNGLAFAGLDKALVALDLRSGTTLWKYVVPNYLDASPIVVPSGVYAADDSGNVYAFSVR